MRGIGDDPLPYQSGMHCRYPKRTCCFPLPSWHTQFEKLCHLVKTERLRGRTGEKVKRLRLWNPNLFNQGSIYRINCGSYEVEKLTPVPMELIFVDRERTTALDPKIQAKDTCIQLLKMIHVHKVVRNGTEMVTESEREMENSTIWAWQVIILLQ